jgi:hypothetical protein
VNARFFSGVRLEILGQCSVQWTEDDGDEGSYEYTDTEMYVDHKVYIFGSEKGDEKIAKGEHKVK